MKYRRSTRQAAAANPAPAANPAAAANPAPAAHQAAAIGTWAAGVGRSAATAYPPPAAHQAAAIGTRAAALLVLVAVLVSCVSSPEPAMPSDVLYVNLMWHQHQPYYHRDPETGVFSRPWVRVHATKDYYDMAEILRAYPDVRVTFNLTPVLLRQIEELNAGAKDVYWVISERHPAELTGDEKRFILERFFDADWDNLIGRFPRYTELLRRREQVDTRAPEGIAAFSEQDYLDLQVFFNLVWFDPMFLESEPLSTLVRKGGGFDHADKRIVFDEARRVTAQVIPVHRELLEAGQIELTTTPYAHPILPLLFTTNLAAVGDPTAELPDEFYYPGDAVAHLEKAVEAHRRRFGRDPVGLWPAEGAVAQEIVKMVADAGFRWMASGEPVLARSLGIDAFLRDETDTVVDADALYRPYIVQAPRSEPVAIVFRDLRLSDLIGFEYSGTPGEQAAADLMRRLELIRRRLQEQTGGEGGPHLVSIILDGENAWEHYPNDGHAFLHALYRMLSESQTIRTTTVSEFMDAFPDQRRLDRLWPGSWFSSDYATWIGEREETKAWNLLGRVRGFLALYDMRGRRQTTPERLERALDSMHLAQGSDWFWWFGDDQDSGQDEYFDEAFRDLLADVFRALDEPVPDYLRVPIIAERAAPPEQRPTATFTPVLDGVADEWEAGGYYRRVGHVQARAADVLETLRYGFDSASFHIAFETLVPLDEAFARGSVHVYFGHPAHVVTSPFVNAPDNPLIGFDASLYAEVTSEGARVHRRGSFGWVEQTDELPVAFGPRTIETSVPFEVLGDLEGADRISFVSFFVEPSGVQDRLPSQGPGLTTVPDLGRGELILAVQDPRGDDHGPGTYTYPTDSVFSPDAFDIVGFVVAREEQYLKFTVEMAAPISNPWGSGIGLSLQTVDIYIDIDPGEGTGARTLLEGRNAAMPEGYGWEYALWVEGWHQRVLVPADPTDPASRPVEMSGSPLRVRVDADAGRIVIRLPVEIIEEHGDASQFGYTVVVLSQEGFPSAGVRRVRDIERTSRQWAFGGAPDDRNHTRIVDMVVPPDAVVTQEALLSDYRPVRDAGAGVSPDDLPRAHVIQAK